MNGVHGGATEESAGAGPATPGRNVAGAIIAGGLSSRFGSPKALATVGGLRVVDRVASSLRNALGNDIFAIVNDDDLAHEIGLPHHRDVIRDAGALGGVHAALVHARERGRTGIIAVGCDMPFIPPALLTRLLGHVTANDVVLPSSPGRRGVEPLCAFYGISCIDAIGKKLADGDARMIGFHELVRVHQLPLDEVEVFGDPAMIFMNLNTEADRAAAERLAAES